MLLKASRDMTTKSARVVVSQWMVEFMQGVRFMEIREISVSGVRKPSPDSHSLVEWRNLRILCRFRSRRNHPNRLLIGHALLTTTGDTHRQNNKPSGQEDGHDNITSGRKSQRKDSNATQNDIATLFLLIRTHFVDNVTTLNIHQDHRNADDELVGFH